MEEFFSVHNQFDKSQKLTSKNVTAVLNDSTDNERRGSAGDKGLEREMVSF